MDAPITLQEAAAALCAAMEGEPFISTSSGVVQAFRIAAGDITPVADAPAAEPAEPAAEAVSTLIPEETHENNL